MTELLASTWASRELPILAGALRRLDAGEFFVNLEQLREEVGLDVAQMRVGLSALASDGAPFLTRSCRLQSLEHVLGVDRQFGRLDLLRGRRQDVLDRSGRSHAGDGPGGLHPALVLVSANSCGEITFAPGGGWAYFTPQGG